MIIIKKLLADRWEDYRDLRLEALKQDPNAFGSSYEEEVILSKDVWEKRIKDVLFALSNNKPIGMIVFIFDKKMKTKHIANIYGVYVKKEYRGLGIGSKLIKSAISKIMKNKTIIKIKLKVNPKQKAAVNLYMKFGFTVAGRLKKELIVNSRFYDDLIMEKIIR